MHLTISIPTYNRNAVLLRNLKRLLPQLTPHCVLRIVDNCSEVPVEETLRPLLDEFPQVQHEIVRNPANIGGNANIVRCFELCQTPWLWVLGDDDPVHENAVDVILRHIAEHPDCFYFNFSCDSWRQETILATGLDQLVRRMDASANLPSISSSVYHAPPFRSNLRFGYHYAYSMLPHVALLVVSLGREGQCCLSRERIIRHDEEHVVPIEQQWSMVNLALGAGVLLDLPFKARTRRMFWRKLLFTREGGEGLKLRGVADNLIDMALEGDDGRGARETALYLWDQICARVAYFEKRPRHRAELRLYRALLQQPRLGRQFFVLSRRVKGKPLDAVKPARYQRL